MAPPPGIPKNLTALGSNLLIALNRFASSNVVSYNLKRSVVNGGSYSTIANVATTNYSGAAVNPGTAYYSVVSGANSARESANSTQASAVPQPSLVSTNLNFQVSGNQLQLSWPQDHLGWRLPVQTGYLGSGLGENWFDWQDSTNVFGTNIVITPVNNSVFFRLVYP